MKKPRPSRRKVPRQDVREELRFKYAQKIGEMVTAQLKPSALCEPWYRWTVSLALAMAMRHAII